MPAKHSKPKSAARGVSVDTARDLILALPGVTEGRSYGMPSFMLEGRFFARSGMMTRCLLAQRVRRPRRTRPRR